MTNVVSATKMAEEEDVGTVRKRDYSLTGPASRRAVEIGLASADWYHTDIPRAEMKKLMRRSDQPAIRDTVIYYGAMIVLAVVAINLWPSWWSAPFWLAYGVLYGSGADSRWHECGHGTAFKTPWMNDVVYQIACFMIVRNPVVWRWSHARHHTDTIIVGRDPEIAAMRPPDVLKIAGLFLGYGTLPSWKRMLQHAAGRLTAEEASYIPERERHKAFLAPRIWTLIYAATIALAIYLGSILPLMVIGLPSLYGAWHSVMTGLLQHAGMAEDVIDHRLNSRTVLINPISRFIYWNMNYHIEHHMFPMVPYHTLPKLHAMIKDDLPAPNTGIADGYKEVVAALWKQLSEPDYRIHHALPPTAQPYREDLHEEALGSPAE